MKRQTIVEILMERDRIPREEAQQRVDQAREDFNERLAQGRPPWDLCYEHFNLDEDFLDEFLY